MQKCELAALHLFSNLSISVNGADQTKFFLPHFTTSVNDQHGHSIAVNLVGRLRHSSINKLWQFMMPYEHGSGANHIIDSVQTLINEIYESEGGLPRSFPPVDNWWIHNKNRYLIAHLE